MNNDIQVIQNGSNKLIARATALEITSPEAVREGTEMLSQMNKVIDQIKVEKEKVLKPLRESAKAEKERWKPFEDSVKPIIESLRKKLSVYQTEQVKLRKAEEEKIAKRMKPGKGNFKAETAVRKLGEVDGPEEKVEVESGGLSFREKKVLKITDEKKIPKQFWIVDEDAVFEALKDGDKVPGAEIDVEMIPVNKR